MKKISFGVLIALSSLILSSTLATKSEASSIFHPINAPNKLLANNPTNNLNENWKITNWYSQDQESPERIFKQSQYNASTDQYEVGINAADLGPTRMTSIRQFELKKGTTYKIKVNFFISMNRVNLDETYIDFNGHRRFNQPTPNTGQVYEEEVTPTQDEVYTITMNLDCYKGANVTMLLNYGDGDGFHEQVPSPTVDLIKAGHSGVTGSGLPGYNIIVKDEQNGQPGNIIGTGIVDNDGYYQLTINRPAIADEYFYVYQANSDGVISVPKRIRVINLD